FKERGALNKLASLSEAEKARGVMAASARHHAPGVFYHAQRLGVRERTSMPLTTPLIKVSSTRGYGAEVVLAGGNYDEAFAEASARCSEEGWTFVHPFDDEAVIAGQGTLGLEILAQFPYLEAV